jgi:peptide/nickel transport system permease protein
MSIETPPAEAVVHEGAAVERSAFRQLLSDMWRDKAATIGAFYLAILLLATIAAPLIAPYDPADQNLADRLLDPAWTEEGTSDHLLGTDNLGRDVLSRLIFGARISMAVGFSVVIIAGTIGIGAGLIAGYKGGRTDSIIMRIVDTQVAFPGLLLALIILTVIGPAVTTVIIVLSINGWMVYARVTRGAVLSAKERGYVEAAELIGAKPKRVILRHILPALTAPLTTLAILEFARIILAEAALSFLGLGVQPPQTSWGLDVAIGRDYIFNTPWLIVFPGIAIALTVLSANMVASWLRVRSNPLAREKRYAEDTEGQDAGAGV